MKFTIPQIAKAVVALALATLTALGTVVADGSFEWVELTGLIGAVVTAWGVYQKRNAPAPSV